MSAETQVGYIPTDEDVELLARNQHERLWRGLDADAWGFDELPAKTKAAWLTDARNDLLAIGAIVERERRAAYERGLRRGQRGGS